MIKTRIRDLTIKGLVMAVAGFGLTLDAMAKTKEIVGYQVECSGEKRETCRHESWRFISENSREVFFVETRKAKQKDVAWVLSMPKKGLDSFGKFSAVAAFQMNCSTGELRSKGITHFNQPWGNGDFIGEKKPNGQWRLVRPGSPAESFYDYVCSKK